MNKKTLQFDDIGYSDFQRMALDSNLSAYEKIGFPDQYRDGYEGQIYNDIRSKLTNLDIIDSLVLDIGPGCSSLPNLLIKDCETRNQTIVLIDSPEMLAQIPDKNNIRKISGPYPDCHDSLGDWIGRFNVVLCYSVFHYIFTEQRFWSFIDNALKLLAPGGQMLIGDIPNISKRKRFFSSENGISFHQNFTGTSEVPEVNFLQIEDDKIDDAVLLGLIMRVRAQGFDAYWLPQHGGLPMSNRREDILISRP